MNVRSAGSIPLSATSAGPVPPTRRVRQALLIVLGLGVLAAGPALAQEGAATGAAEPATAEAAPAAKPGKEDRKGKVCRNEDVTGSRMPKRVCHTPEQWAARERAAKEAVREMDARPVGKIGEGG